MPIAPPNSPLLDLMYTPSQDVGETISREDMMEIQREQEARLLGTFFIQAIFLALSIMLYSAWEWSQFSEPWESALFYGLMAFSLQAALYFTYRTMFEDSSNYRKELKRMKNKQRKRMAQMSFEMRKMQTETLLTQQMQQYQQQMALANADGYIDNSEQAMLTATTSSYSANGGWRGKRPRPRENGEAIGNRPIQGGAHSSRSKVNFIPRTYNQHAHSGKLAEPEPQPRVEYRLASPRDSGMRCQALTADKAQCKRYSDEQFCWQHRPKQPRKVSKVRSGDMDKVLTV